MEARCGRAGRLVLDEAEDAGRWQQVDAVRHLAAAALGGGRRQWRAFRSKAEEVTGSRSRPGPGEGGSAWAQEEEARWRCGGGELAGTPSGRGRRGALLLSACRSAGGGRWGEGIGRERERDGGARGKEEEEEMDRGEARVIGLGGLAGLMGRSGWSGPRGRLGWLLSPLFS